MQSMIEIVRHTQRDVKRWQDADTTERSTDTASAAALVTSDHHDPRGSPPKFYDDPDNLSDIRGVPEGPSPEDDARQDQNKTQGQDADVQAGEGQVRAGKERAPLLGASTALAPPSACVTGCGTAAGRAAASWSNAGVG